MRVAEEADLSRDMGPAQAGLRARDVMVPLDKYPSVLAETTLAEAAVKLSEWHIDFHGSLSMPRYALVLNKSADLEGIVRRRDILRGLAPSFLIADQSDHPEKMFEMEVDPNLAELLSDRAPEKLKNKAKTLVSEVLRPIEATVNIDDPLIMIIQEMVRRDEAIIPVLENEHVVGVVRTIEVLEAVAQMIHTEGDDDETA